MSTGFCFTHLSHRLRWSSFMPLLPLIRPSCSFYRRLCAVLNMSVCFHLQLVVFMMFALHLGKWLLLLLLLSGHSVAGIVATMERFHCHLLRRISNLIWLL